MQRLIAPRPLPQPGTTGPVCRVVGPWRADPSAPETLLTKVFQATPVPLIAARCGERRPVLRDALQGWNSGPLSGPLSGSAGWSVERGCPLYAVAHSPAATIRTVQKCGQRHARNQSTWA